MANILVLAPHPDDESIGCGGTIRKHVVDGDTVEVIFATSGEKGGHGIPPKEAGRTREREGLDATAILGCSRTEFWREPDGGLSVTPENVHRLFRKIVEYR